MFDTLIVQPIFNLLLLIYNLIPGHNFGLAIIIFTVLVRLAMWPLVKRQLHQTKLIRKLQPELKQIKAKAKGDRQKESLMMMELYKERGVSLFGTFRVLIVQFIILLGLYSGLRKILGDPRQLVDFAYPFVQGFDFMRQLAANIDLFDETLVGLVNLTRPALGEGGIYWPAMLIVAASAFAQYFQTKQLMPVGKDSKSLRQILSAAKNGEQADQADVNEAMGRYMRYVFPVLIFVFTINIPSAISLYWLVSGLVAFVQQSIVLREDENEMEATAEAKPATARAAAAVEGEVVERPAPRKPNKRKPAKTTKRRKR